MCIETTKIKKKRPGMANYKKKKEDETRKLNILESVGVRFLNFLTTLVKKKIGRRDPS